MKKMIFLMIAVLCLVGCEFQEEQEEYFQICYFVTGTSENAIIEYIDENENIQIAHKDGSDWSYVFESENMDFDYYLNVKNNDENGYVKLHVIKDSETWGIGCENICEVIINTN